MADKKKAARNPQEQTLLIVRDWNGNTLAKVDLDVETERIWGGVFRIGTQAGTVILTLDLEEGS